MKTKSILIVSLSSASRLRVPTIPLYKNQRRPIALSEPNFVFDGVFYFSSDFNVFTSF